MLVDDHIERNLKSQCSLHGRDLHLVIVPPLMLEVVAFGLAYIYRWPYNVGKYPRLTMVLQN